MDRTQLVKKLELASRALANNNLIEIYQSFRFSNGKVLAYNDVLGISTDCEIEDEFLVDGVTLRDLLKATTAEEIEVNLEDDHVSIIAEKSLFKLPFREIDDFPFEEPKDKWDVSLTMDEAFIKGMEICLVTSATDQTQEAIMGVSLRAAGKVLALYSCDGDALTRFRTTAHVKDAKQHYMLPNSFCEAITKMFGELECEEALLEVNGEWAKATLGDCIVYGRIQTKEPEFDYEAHIKKAVKGEIKGVPVPIDFNDALSRARVVADREGKATQLEIFKGKLNLVTKVDHLGIIRDGMVIRGHADAQASISARLVQRAIAVCHEMAVCENCCVFTDGEAVMQIVANLNE